MNKILIICFLLCPLSIFGVNKDNNVYRSLCNFLTSEGLFTDSAQALKDSSVFVVELLTGDKDFSKPFGIYLFNNEGYYDYPDYVLIKENQEYWIYKEISGLTLISEMLRINKDSPNLLSDERCFEYIKKFLSLEEPELLVSQKRGMFHFVDHSRKYKMIKK